MSGRWVGIDPGEKYIGVARSDPLGMMAHPRAIVGSYSELLTLLREWLVEGPIEGVVVGVPINMDGGIGPMALRSFDLIRRLRGELDIDTHPWDERLTTRQVERQAPPPRSRGRIDDRAAAVILQSFLDAGCPNRPDPPELRAD